MRIFSTILMYFSMPSSSSCQKINSSAVCDLKESPIPIFTELKGITAWSDTVG